VRALVVDPSAEVGFSFGEVPEPVPGSTQVLVEVHHVSLNHGDLNDARSGRVPVGGVLGSDVAGVVTEGATPGGRPRPGARVVGLTAGAFAERCVLDVGMLAEVPPTADLAASVGLPVAGLAALRALRAGGSGAGRRVLVTGASGGVGRFAVQLAAQSGAHVIAAVGTKARGEGLAELGAADVVVGLDAVDAPVDVVVDNVGGPTLVQAWELLAPGGDLQSVGWTSGEPAVFPPYSTVGPPKSLSSFLNQGDVAADLAILVDLLARDVLTVDIGWRGSWDGAEEAARALRDRRVSGKAVLDVGPTTHGP
jgi:NADPH:quinone reductase